MKSISCKVLIIGAGPGGYVAAIRAGQLGLDTVIVEGERSGGTCLIRGCIPSKALIHAATRFEEINAHTGEGKLGISVSSVPELDLNKMMDWKESIINRLSTGVEGLLKKNGVNQIKGWANFKNAKTCEVETVDGLVTITTEHVILANGSKVTELPSIPFSKNVISSTEALQQTELPKHLVVIGAGYIGLEMGIVYRKLGAKVTFIEGLDRLLPLYDKEMTKPISTWLKKHQIEVIYKARANSVSDEGGTVTLHYSDKNDKAKTIEADKVLVTIGRRPNTQGWGLENMCIDMDGAFIKVNNQCQTTMKNV
ncbi:MAG: FAD-dependent oxidoreductase, partial [Gammaproteobacteria bacterium]|nr:FAD-dependent oxidoreductase [Gammaproteobacteria bacterium]